MRFAQIDNDKHVEAKPGLKALCPGCSEPVIAKCGKQRIPHWAHRSSKACDSWWEPETEWHRSWKNNFPVEWQEVFLPDKRTGEKHIADIRTGQGLVIEFQHSHLDPQERVQREKFYKNMVWVVDGTRLKRDYQRFLKCSNGFTGKEKYFFTTFPDKCFPASWLESTAPVIFDFRNAAEPQDGIRNLLWCMFPERVEGRAMVMALSHEIFMAIALKHPRFISLRDLLAPQTQQKQIQKQPPRIMVIPGSYVRPRGPRIDEIEARREQKEFSRQQRQYFRRSKKRF